MAEHYFANLRDGCGGVRDTYCDFLYNKVGYAR